MNIDSILFDLDGTLWDAVDEIIHTWNIIIGRYPGLRAPITRAEQERVMGLQMDEIADRLFPSERPERRMELMDECIREENQYLAEHGGTLYPNVEETLKLLHQKYRLFIVSNCQSGYIEAFLTAHKLADYFTGYLCYGDTKLSKGENNQILIKRYGLTQPIYVGDTAGDLRSARFSGIPFVYATYGFGAVDQFDACIQSFEELQQPDFFKNMQILQKDKGDKNA